MSMPDACHRSMNIRLAEIKAVRKKIEGWLEELATETRRLVNIPLGGPCGIPGCECTPEQKEPARVFSLPNPSRIPTGSQQNPSERYSEVRGDHP